MRKDPNNMIDRMANCKKKEGNKKKAKNSSNKKIEI